MNSKLDDLMYQAGLTAQGCWDEMDAYDRAAVMKLAELIVRDCASISEQHNRNYYKSHGQIIADKIKKHFGVE